MYTGIIQEVGTITNVAKRANTHGISIRASSDFLTDLRVGNSISVDGVCHTVTDVSPSGVRIDSGYETLTTTTMASAEDGHQVHLERSVRHGQEVGGHTVSGHVDGTAEVIAVSSVGECLVVQLRVPATLIRYVFNKGFIAVHGASLTVNNLRRDAAQFEVCLVPETLAKTTFSSARVGTRFNIEIDRAAQVVVDTISTALREALSQMAGKIPAAAAS
jgi:riboflavin synthase